MLRLQNANSTAVLHLSEYDQKDHKELIPHKRGLFLLLPAEHVAGAPGLGVPRVLKVLAASRAWGNIMLGRKFTCIQIKHVDNIVGI